MIYLTPMNFLAHLYLSGNDSNVMTGNFIGDFVKGRDLKEKFGGGIAKGIELHRAIDDFTDHHSVVKQSKTRLWPKYRHYSAVIVDIFYDHFLAAQWSLHSGEPLALYAERVYKIILNQQALLPDRVNQMLPYMVSGNWLVNYAKIEGIERALTGMARRASFESKMQEATVDLRNSYGGFQSEFNIFFPELKNFCSEWLISRGPSPQSLPPRGL